MVSILPSMSPHTLRVRRSRSSSLTRSGLAAALLLTLLGAGSAVRADSPAPPDWENPAVFGRNKEPAHAYKTPFPTAKAALAGPVENSPWRVSLNGEWRLHWSPLPDGIPAGFERPDFDDSGWSTIPVPSNLEMQERK